MTRGLATCNSADRAWTSCLRRSWAPSQVSGTHLNTFSSSTTLRWALAVHHSVHVRIHRTNIWSLVFKKQRLSEQCIGMNGEKWQRCIYLGERSSYLCHLVRPVSPLIPRTSSFVQIKALHSFDRVFLRFKIFVLVAFYPLLPGQRWGATGFKFFLYMYICLYLYLHLYQYLHLYLHLHLYLYFHLYRYLHLYLHLHLHLYLYLHFMCICTLFVFAFASVFEFVTVSFVMLLDAGQSLTKEVLPGHTWSTRFGKKSACVIVFVFVSVFSLLHVPKFIQDFLTYFPSYSILSPPAGARAGQGCSTTSGSRETTFHKQQHHGEIQFSPHHK